MNFFRVKTAIKRWSCTGFNYEGADIQCKIRPSFCSVYKHCLSVKKENIDDDTSTLELKKKVQISFSSVTTEL